MKHLSFLLMLALAVAVAAVPEGAEARHRRGRRSPFGTLPPRICSEPSYVLQGSGLYWQNRPLRMCML